MDPRMLARLCGVLGGLVWAVRWLLPDPGEAVLGAAYGAGLALLAIGLGGAGAGMAGTAWLRLVVGICFPLLAWSVLMALHEAGDDVAVDGLVGVVAVLVWVPALGRARRRERRRERLGAHAA